MRGACAAYQHVAVFASSEACALLLRKAGDTAPGGFTPDAYTTYTSFGGSVEASTYYLQQTSLQVRVDEWRAFVVRRMHSTQCGEA